MADQTIQLAQRNSTTRGAGGIEGWFLSQSMLDRILVVLALLFLVIGPSLRNRVIAGMWVLYTLVAWKQEQFPAGSQPARVYGFFRFVLVLLALALLGTCTLGQLTGP